MDFIAKQKYNIEARGTIIRADGRREDLGVLARSKPRRLGWLLALLILAFALTGLHAIGLAAGLLGATLLVNTGRAISTGLLTAVTALQPKFIGWGTGAGSFVATSTALFTEAVETSTVRPTCTLARATTSTTNDTAQFSGSITVTTAPKTITNLGLFDANNGGNLFLGIDGVSLALLVGDTFLPVISVAQA